MRVVITNATVDRGAVAARSLRAAGFEVHGFDARRVPRFMVSRHLRSYTCIDDEDPRARQDSVLRLIEQLRADVVLPLDTPSAVMAVHRRRELADLCLVNTPATEAFLTAYDKRRTMAACNELGIPCAGSLSRDEAADMLQGHPERAVVVKPAQDVGGAVGLRTIADVQSLDTAIQACSVRHGGCIIQERIPGPAEAMRMVTVLYNSHGRLVGAFTARKLRQWPPGGGVTAYGVSTRDDDLLALVRPFFGRSRWRGIAEVELKRDARDGTFKVIEINPRPPGYLRHASLCGLDLAAAAVRATLGEDQPEVTALPEYREGVVYLAPAVFAKAVAHEAGTSGWASALGHACSDAVSAGPMLMSLLADPIPNITRTFVKMRSCSALPFDEQ